MSFFLAYIFYSLFFMYHINMKGLCDDAFDNITAEAVFVFVFCALIWPVGVFLTVNEAADEIRKLKTKVRLRD